MTEHREVAPVTEPSGDVVADLNALNAVTKRIRTATEKQHALAEQRRAIIARLRAAGLGWGAMGAAMGTGAQGPQNALKGSG